MAAGLPLSTCSFYSKAEFAESGFRFMPSWSLSRMCTGASHGSRAAVVYMQLLQQS